MQEQKEQALIVYGSRISYFTGKLENYLRVKNIPYQFEVLGPRIRKRLQREVGSGQFPAMELPDGRLMTDTTPIIQWLEENYAGQRLIPANPLQRFFSLLLEDYADEWLWRPAMHYRWYCPHGAHFASDHLGRELLGASPVPVFLRRWILTNRQRRGFTAGDGIGPDAVAGVEAIYSRMLQQLEAIFRQRPFMLGNSPSLADIGFSGPIFRHFALDPVPAEIMRQTAPATYEWVARLWGHTENEVHWLEGVPEDWGPILQAIGTDYLPYLNANIEAVSAGQSRFDANVGGVPYTKAISSRYRVWCLAKLREAFDALDESTQALAKALLAQHGAWEPLWQYKELPMAEGFLGDLPFRTQANMLDVY